MRERKFRALDRELGRWFYLTLEELANGESSAWCDVDMDTASDYLGCKDKNGVEIYEGDVVQAAKGAYFWGRCAVVSWDEDRFELEEIKTERQGEVFYDPMGARFSWSELKVIGNLYENPELVPPKED